MISSEISKLQYMKKFNDQIWRSEEHFIGLGFSNRIYLQ